MTSERIKEIQEQTAYPESVGVMLALKQVWNECEQEKSYSEEEVLSLLEDRSFHCCGATKMSYIPTKEWFQTNKK